MKHRAPLSFHLSIAMVFLVAGTVILCWILNNTFLEKYYVYNKEQELLSGFFTIDEADRNGTLEQESFDIAFEKICANGNISILIINYYNLKIIRSYMVNDQLFFRQWEDVMYGIDEKNAVIVKKTDRYVLARENDSRMQSDYLILCGQLGNGKYIYMRTAMASIKESAEITNRFFAWIGIGAILVSFVLIVILSNTISRPILEMAHISRRMSMLDFEAKYKSKRHRSRELEVLGQHMNELSETLERTISELKAANNELKKDIQKKEQIDEMRKEFLSNVSHELKTPLALIQGYAEGLKEGISEDAESREFYCDVIVDESDKMNRMVKKILTLNQLEFGNDVVEMVRFDVTELLKGLVTTNALLAEQEGITLDLRETEPLYVWGDEFKVEEVLSNYLSNALHHAEGEKKISIFVTKRENVLRVSVFNTGKQIPESELDKIWNKFYKVDKARTRAYGGSGIGLSIAKAIMDSMHQQCGVINHPEGVEFWLELDRG